MKTSLCLAFAASPLFFAPQAKAIYSVEVPAIQVRILDQDRKPIQNAVVSYSVWIKKCGLPGPYGGDPCGSEPLVGKATNGLRALTDANGTVSFESLKKAGLRGSSPDLQISLEGLTLPGYEACYPMTSYRVVSTTSPTGPMCLLRLSGTDITTRTPKSFECVLKADAEVSISQALQGWQRSCSR